MPRRKRSSFGTVERRGRDTWRIRWNQVRGGIAERPSETVHGTRKDAERRLAEIWLGLKGPTGPGRRLAAPMTVREVWERWYEPDEEARVQSGRMALRTREQHKSSIRLLLRLFGDRPIGSIRATEVQDMLSGLTKQPAVNAITALRRLMDYAVTYDVMAENVARRRYVMPQAEAARDTSAYSFDELLRIAGAARGSVAEAPILLMMFGSCRVAESIPPRLEEVERWESRGLTLAVVWVNRQVLRDRDLSDRLKTESSRRPVVILPPWSERVLELAEEGRGRGEVYLADEGIGRPISRWRLTQEWKRVVTEAGLPVLERRAARRSWETWMNWDMDMQWQKTERLMGHAIPGVTGRHYDKPHVRQFVDAVALAYLRRREDGFGTS